MKEEFVQYLWAERLILSSDLILVDGTACQVIKTGEWNEHSGPDFKDAIVRIGDATWVGQVEVHLCSSDWKAHGHYKDPAYDNVILHLVLEDDDPVMDRKGKPIPCLVLHKEKYEAHHRQYENWINKNADLPCVEHSAQTPPEVWLNWLSFLGARRFVEKLNVGWSTLESTRGDIELTRWILLGRTMGAPLNEDGMEMLIRSIPWNQVRRREWGFSDFSNWLLYMAGLNYRSFPDHLKHVFAMEPLNKRIWLYGKLRPSSFPKIRVQQWSWYFFKAILQRQSEVPFWESSFWIDYPEKHKPGRQSLHTWRINMTPYQYVGDWNRKESNAEVWKDIGPEKNGIINRYESLFGPPENAFQSQALLKLNKEFCRQKKCLNCAVGNHHLKRQLHDR